jgi:hypothetical protein
VCSNSAVKVKVATVIFMAGLSLALFGD